MSSEILVALLSFLGTILGTFSGIKLMSYRIEQLEKKVEKHNNLVERMYKLEENEGILLEKIKSNCHRLDDLEETCK